MPRAGGDDKRFVKPRLRFSHPHKSAAIRTVRTQAAGRWTFRGQEPQSPGVGIMPRTLSTRTLLVVVAGFILFISPQAVVGLAAAGKPSLPNADYGNTRCLFSPAEASQCQQNDLPMGTTTSGSLFTDIHNGALPNASMVVPNDCNNAHSCALSTADAWLKSWLSVVFAGPDWTSGHLAVVVTFDEGETTEDVAFVVASPTVPAGTVFTAASDHYSLSRLYAEVLGVAPMNGATSATDLAAPFNLGGTGPLPTPTPTPSPSPSPSASPSPSPLPGPGGFFPKGLFRFGATDFRAMTGAGFNAVTDGDDPTTLNTLGAKGLKGLGWLGPYNNRPCAWDSSDSPGA